MLHCFLGALDFSPLRHSPAAATFAASTEHVNYTISTAVRGDAERYRGCAQGKVESLPLIDMRGKI